MQKMVECGKERKKLKVKLSNFYRFSVGIMAFLYMTSVVAEPAPNPRSAVTANSASRTSAKVITRGDGNSGAVVSRTGLDVEHSGRSDVVVRTGRKNTVARSSAPVATTNRSAGADVSRSAARGKASRSATTQGKVNARAATSTKSGMGRAATLARATAVFNDLSKIGGGYAQCRESYATCMDQFCANSSDTYRRCYCSQRFKEFRDTEAMLDEVKVLLQRFEDNNLNAVDKTVAEVNAMYTATVGEEAIKTDVSGAQNTLNEISDLLSGKKKPGESKKADNPMDVSFGFDINMDDLWNSTNSMFDTTKKTSSITDLDGQALFNESNKQCLELVQDTCSAEAVLNMATSSYNVMIAQDCNLYEKKIDSQREAVMNTVRQAEKFLRKARLEEYRAHNSADVNECLNKVRNAMMQEVACGENYRRCLDYTGNYINTTTGEPIYSPLLFKLNELINLYGGNGLNSDVIAMNPQYNKWLDDRRMFATTALDSCRDIADMVWTEFKRSAIIEINQAQDAKIEEVKSSCVSTMGECYDTQAGELKKFDNTTAKMAGAVSAQTSRAMCAEKVAACAALYNNGGGCQFDSRTGRVQNAKECGLEELLNYVGLVDSVKMAEGCTDALTKYTKELCAPASNDDESREYPWGCRALKRDDLVGNIASQAEIYCVSADDVNDDEKLRRNVLDGNNVASKIAETLEEEIQIMLENECGEYGGVWMPAYCASSSTNGGCATYEFENSELTFDSRPVQDFYVAINGKKWDTTKEDKTKGHDSANYGMCFENTVQTQCMSQDSDTGGKGYAKYKDGKCFFEEQWYQYQCEQIGGYYVDKQCYIRSDE